MKLKKEKTFASVNQLINESANHFSTAASIWPASGAGRSAQCSWRQWTPHRPWRWRCCRFSFGEAGDILLCLNAGACLLQVKRRLHTDCWLNLICHTVWPDICVSVGQICSSLINERGAPLCFLTALWGWQLGALVPTFILREAVK